MVFKECPHCRQVWPDRKAFLSDETISLVGYQANFGDLEAGYFLFNHNIPICSTSMAIEAGEFKDLHEGPIFQERMTGKPECPGYCKDVHSLAPCTNKCECAYVRDVLQTVKNWPKEPIQKAS